MAEFVGFRLAAWDTALRVNPHREPGRYHRAGSSATQYFGLHPLTPWAEYLRAHDLRHRDDVTDPRIRTWVVRIPSDSVVDVSFENAGDFALEPEDLVADDWSACQAFADRLRGDAGAPKVVRVPSAALPGTYNIVIFGERVRVEYDEDPADEVDLPEGVVAEEGRPPFHLPSKVCYRDDEHLGLTAWRNGRAFSFASGM
jgi:RES domain-containing protein